MSINSKITTCLWFDNQAEEAANFYTSIFKDSSIGHVSRYTDSGKEFHGQKVEKVMTVQFKLNGQSFVGLNGGPVFEFNPAISFQVECEDQDEIDYYWSKLGEGGDATKQRCGSYIMFGCVRFTDQLAPGWLADKYGVSWQVIPKRLSELIGNPDKVKAKRASDAMFTMKKFVIAGLEKAFNGE